MAGIGFELRRLLQSRTYSALVAAYGTAGVISAGPLAISVIGILAVGLLTFGGNGKPEFVEQFQVSVTYLMASSLVFAAPLQILITRFTADCIYSKRLTSILPNLAGACAIATVGGGLLAAVLVSCCFSGSVFYRVLMLSGFVLLNNIWILMALLSSVRVWRTVLIAFVLGYTVTVGAGYALRDNGLEGLLFAFVAGHALLLVILFGAVTRSYPLQPDSLFTFLTAGRRYASLALTALLYNIGIWADKVIFWESPLTGEQVLGPLRHSLIYDAPVFLAYLSIIPGMAVFFVRVETDFADNYESFYKAIRQGATLHELMRRKADIVASIRDGLFEIAKVQGVFVVLLIASGDFVLELFGIPQLQRPLFNIFVAAAGVQLLMMAVLNVFFYFDWRAAALALTAFFTGANVVLTLISLELGVPFFGYGFVVALLLTTGIGIGMLREKLAKLEYETFVLQKVVF